MTIEEKGDARLAVVIVVVAFLIGLLCGQAMACESYEECVQIGESLAHGVSFQSNNNEKYSEQVTKESCYLKAIAYKLDEISKKLNNSKNDCYDLSKMKKMSQEDCDKEISQNLTINKKYGVNEPFPVKGLNKKKLKKSMIEKKKENINATTKP